MRIAAPFNSAGDSITYSWREAFVALGEVTGHAQAVMAEAIRHDQGVFLKDVVWRGVALQGLFDQVVSGLRQGEPRHAHKQAQQGEQARPHVPPRLRTRAAITRANSAYTVFIDATSSG
jgi:hypothetical protein